MQTEVFQKTLENLTGLKDFHGIISINIKINTLAPQTHPPHSLVRLEQYKLLRTRRPLNYEKNKKG